MFFYRPILLLDNCRHQFFIDSDFTNAVYDVFESDKLEMCIIFCFQYDFPNSIMYKKYG